MQKPDELVCCIPFLYSPLLASLLPVEEYKKSREHAEQNLKDKIDELKTKNQQLRTEADTTEKSNGDLRRQIARLTSYNSRSESPVSHYSKHHRHLIDVLSEHPS